jgi:hypothetical protein
MMLILREHSCNGKKYRIYAPTSKDRKAVEVIGHNIKAFSANGNQAAVFNEFASMLAVVLTPEGMDPTAKDREEARKEILALPFGFIIEVMSDIVRTTEARGR